MDYGWSPGCWVWYQGRYAWQPGYWAQGRADWDWMPAHYVWTPRGYIFVGGYWDYPIQRRGIVFAPVYFESSYYARRGYVYSPSIVISLGVFTDHLFLRPSYGHYYFGDYYAPSYHQSGFYASFSFQSSRHGYDPFYSRQRWTHRQDRDWERRTESSYHYRRDHETARPPRTWAAQRNISPSTAESGQNRMLVAAPIGQVAKRKDNPMRFQAVAKAERQQLFVRGQEVQKSREQRRTLEATTVGATPRRSGEAFQPAKVEMPRSPIVAKPANESGRDQTPPQAQQAPKPDLNRQPKAEPAARPQNAERNRPQVEPRQSVPQRKSVPGRDEAAPREKQVQPQARPKAERRPEQSEKPTQRETPKNDRKLEAPAPARAAQPVKDAPGTLREDSQRNPPGLEKKTPPTPEPTAQGRAVKPREESQRNASEQEPKAVRRSEQPAKDAARNPSEDSQRKARGVEGNPSTEPTPRAQDRAVKPRQESPRNAAGLEPKSSGGSVQPVRKSPAMIEKGATRQMKNDRRKEGKGKP